MIMVDQSQQNTRDPKLIIVDPKRRRTNKEDIVDRSWGQNKRPNEQMEHDVVNALVAGRDDLVR